MQEDDTKRPRYSACHICKVPRPVESVAMLCCYDDKTWEDDGDWIYLLLDGDFVKVNI